MATVVTNAGALHAVTLPGLAATSLRLARVGQAGAQRRARVDTGEMRDSIEAHGIGGAGATWGSSNGHMAYNEFGTVHMSAQPMVRPSVDDLRAAL
jgi:HK97 gp10 family phage protein